MPGSAAETGRGRLRVAWLGLCVGLSLGACTTVQDGNRSRSEQPSLERGPLPEKRRVAGGDTQSQGDKPGIGGTGQYARERPGIGGTGTYADGTPGIGGTGIIGTVTGFGSILVNGFEIDYRNDLPVAYKDRTARPDALRVGQIVAVEADGEGTRLQARSIAVRHEVAGPIERIDRKARRLAVLGQTVALPEGAILEDAGSQPLRFSRLAVGDSIDVSGLRRGDGVITASRLDAARPGSPALIRGTVTAVDARGFTVEGLRVEAPAGSRPAGIAPGRQVAISGSPERRRLRARRIRVEPTRPFAGRVGRLSIEGYARRTRAGRLAVGRMPVSRLPSGARARAGERLIVNGAMDERGRFTPTRVRPARLRLRGRDGARPRHRPPPQRLRRPPEHETPARLRRQSAPPRDRLRRQSTPPRVRSRPRPSRPAIRPARPVRPNRR